MNVYRRVYERAAKLLEENKVVPNRTVVFDFDDTLVNTRFDIPSYEPNMGISLFIYEPIPDMVQLLILAKRLGYNVIIITARMPNFEFSVVHNIKQKIPELLNNKIDAVYSSPIPMTGDIEKFKQFKSVLRHHLQQIDLKTAQKISSRDLYHGRFIRAVRNKLNIVLTIGDQPHDIANMSMFGILLPRPERNPNMEAYLYRRKNIQQEECLELI